MDNSSSLSNREWRRKAKATHLVARDSGESGNGHDVGGGGSPTKQRKLQQSLLVNAGEGDCNGVDVERSITLHEHTNHDPGWKPKFYHKLPPSPTQLASYYRSNRPTLNCLVVFTTLYLTATSFFSVQNSFGNASNSNIQGNDLDTLGFIVLGMHRSGTSMLSGLLVKGFGYDTGVNLFEGSVSCCASKHLLRILYCEHQANLHMATYIIHHISLTMKKVSLSELMLYIKMISF